MTTTRNPENSFGQIAIDLGLLQAAEVERYLEEQVRGNPPRSLGLILIQEGRLDPVQVNRILEEQNRRRQAEGDEGKAANQIFGRLLIDRGFVGEAELAQVLEDQKLFAGRGYRFPLGQLLQSRGLISAKELGAILALQQKEILVCPSCLVGYNFSFGKASGRENCTRCGGRLVRPRFE